MKKVIDVLRDYKQRLISKIETIYWNMKYKNAKLINGLYEGVERKQKIIVSLTSYPKRFPTLYLCIKSIFYQSMKADKIILYLGDDTCKEDLPDTILELQKYGLSIEFKEGNIKPHKKYYYSMKEYPNDIIITVDDDVIYEKDLIKRLMLSFEQYPDCVSAKRVHKMLFNGHRVLSYNLWEHEDKTLSDPSMQLFAVGVGGVLYPPHCMDDLLFDISKIESLCLNADDVWVKFMQVLHNTKVVYVKGKWCHPIKIIGTQDSGLYYNNLEENQNDVYIRELEQYFGIHLVDYMKEE